MRHLRFGNGQHALAASWRPDTGSHLNGHTLIGLKRLMEVVEDVGGRLSVILAGHPKLRNQLEPKRTAEIRECMLAAGLPI